MSTDANSYGAASDVAALKKRYTTAGSFSTTTNPTTAQVESWIDFVSSTMNIILAEHGFSIPVTQADCVRALKLFVVTEVADLADYANSAGRFFTNQQFATGPWKAISKEAADFIKSHANGFQALGAVRTTQGLSGLDARTMDDAGDDIEPMFARKQFGNRTTDWDPE